MEANKPTTPPESDGRQPEMPSTTLPAGEDVKINREELGTTEGVSRPIAVKQKLFDPEKDNPVKNSPTRRNKFQGKLNSSHRHNSSREFKRPASNDVGEKRPKPRDVSTPKKILQHNAQAEDMEVPQSPGGQDHHDSSQDRDGMPEHPNDDPEPNTEMLRQPETRPISHDQLVVEVKGIYAGLVMVEGKCIDVDEKQSVRAQDDTLRLEPLRDDQWQSLIALHKQLLHEHHDFFLASQHPSASSNLSKLAAKYSMPARMWRHGIHAFLEVLRHRLPQSLEHMLAFIYIAYSMMALLYETVPVFEDTWIECLGDLGRYRMAIEDDVPKDREVWSGVARWWYSKAADKNPTVGRLYHHLAILAPQYTLEQLSLYDRSLTCITPFESARGSIMTLFNPILSGRENGYHKSSPFEQLIIKAHGLLFLFPKKPEHEILDVINEVKDRKKGLIEIYVEKSGARFKRTGVFLAVSNLAALLEFGALTTEGYHRSALRRALHLPEDQVKGTSNGSGPPSAVVKSEDLKSEALDLQPSTFLSPEEVETSKVVFSLASDLTFSVFKIALSASSWERNYILPMVHVMLVFIHSIFENPEAIGLFEKAVPWDSICSYLNGLKIDEEWRDMIWQSETFPSVSGTAGRPPPDDYIMRGQIYTRNLYPDTWFTDAKVDDEERMLEQSSLDAYRTIRVLWLAVRICSAKRWIEYDSETKCFLVTEYVTQNLASTLPTAQVSPKIEPPDETNMMDVVENVDITDQNANSAMATDETKSRETGATDLMDTSEARSPSTSNSKISTDQPGTFDIKTASPVQQEGSNTPVANDPGEPEDTPMMDISPGKEHMLLASTTAVKSEKPSLIGPAAIDSSMASPPKPVAGFMSDPNAVRILQEGNGSGDEDL